MSQVKYRLAFEAVEGKWIVREVDDVDYWKFVGRYPTLEKAEEAIRALAHPPAEREYDEHGNLVGLRVLL
jgi:hypothetical protein